MSFFTKKNYFILFLLTFIAFSIFSQDNTIYIWKSIKEMKNEPSVMFHHKPTVESKHVAVIICPGGSYHHLGLYNESYTTAKWFSSIGCDAFVLKYRTNESGYTHPAMLQDIQRAIQLIRENSDKYNIDKNKIGVIGFSAGGHLVAMAGEFGESHNELSKLGIKTDVSLRPDFVMPIYPVVSMQEDISHKWSKKSLLGKNPTQEQIDEFSLELSVPSSMPPTYIVVAKDDNVVNYENSLRLYDALKNKNIPNCELHLYEWGKHGFGMLNNDFMKNFHWNETLKEWLYKIGIL